MKRFFVMLFLSLGVTASLIAQTINTTIGSTNYNGSNNIGTDGFVTFVIENTTGLPILLTDVGSWTTAADNNGSTSNLYYSATSLSGPITGNAFPAAGWTMVGSGVVNGITTTGVNPVLAGVNFLIPAGAIYRFALTSTGVTHYSGGNAGAVSPNTFTVGGVTMRTGDYQISSLNVGHGGSVASGDFSPRYFTGFVTFAPAPLCTGTPVAGTASFVYGCPLSHVQLSGFTMSAGMTIQWQKREACSGTWTDMPGATNAIYVIPSQATPTEYRAYIICTSNGLSDTSTVASVSAIPPCYCVSGATSVLDTEIFNVSVGNSLNNNSNCTTTGGAGSILTRYSNYTLTLPPLVLAKGANYPFSVQVGTCGTLNYNNGVAIYIDYNINGTFEVPAERVYISAGATLGPHTESGNFTVPVNAGTGLTRMRVVEQESATPNTAIVPCGTFSFGETEDYMVQILYAPSATGGGVFCSGESTALAASAPNLITTGDYGFLWLRPNGTYDTSTTLQLNNLQVTDAGIYKLWVLTYPCGSTGVPDTSGVKEVSVAVNQTPPMPIIAPVIVYCQYDEFDSIAVFGYNLKWYSVPTGGTASSTAPVINTSVFGSVTYYVSQTVAGCEGPRAPVTINVVAKPVPPDVVSPVVYCQGDVPEALKATGQDIKWYSVAQGGVGTPITPTPTTNAQGTYTWYVSQSVAGCESQRVPVEVRVNYIPNALITIDRPYVCQYEELELNYFGNANPDADYLWGIPTGATLVSGSGQGPLVVRFDSAGIRRVDLQVDNGGCKGPATYLDITVRAVPLMTLDMQPDACVGEVVNMAVSFSTPSIDQYNWDFMGGEVVYGSIPAGPYGLKWSTPGIKTITVVATDDDCSSLPITDEINIHELPNATITPLGTTGICVGDSILLEALYDSDHSYRWEPEQFFGANNTNREYARIDQAGYVYLTVSNEYNCIGKDSLLIDALPCCEVSFPNAFTPNGDMRNDIFRMIKRGGTKDISTFRVVNRWGHTIFETTDDNIGWDGTYNGKPQDMGTYQYYVRYKCADGNYYEAKGDVTLIR